MAVKIFLDWTIVGGDTIVQSETKQNLIPLSLRLSSIEFSI